MFSLLRARAPFNAIRQFSTSLPAQKALYVGNISFTVKEDEVRTAFEEFGEVSSIRLVNDRLSGRPRGFGFVEYSDDAAADQAISNMNGKDLGGRNLIVNESVPREPRERGGDRRTSSYGGRGGYNSGGSSGRGGDRGGYNDRRSSRGGEREDY